MKEERRKKNKKSFKKETHLVVAITADTDVG